MSESVCVMKTATCPSLSKKSTLTYQIGTLEDGSIQIRITENTGSGHFCQEWTALPAIEKVLAGDKPITSGLLQPLFKGRSSNSAGFLLAALLDIGLIHIADEKYARTEMEGKSILDTVPLPTAKKKPPQKQQES